MANRSEELRDLAYKLVEVELAEQQKADIKQKAKLGKELAAAIEEFETVIPESEERRKVLSELVRFNYSEETFHYCSQIYTLMGWKEKAERPHGSVSGAMAQMKTLLDFPVGEGLQKKVAAEKAQNQQKTPSSDRLFAIVEKHADPLRKLINSIEAYYQQSPRKAGPSVYVYQRGGAETILLDQPVGLLGCLCAANGNTAIGCFVKPVTADVVEQLAHPVTDDEENVLVDESSSKSAQPVKEDLIAGIKRLRPRNDEIMSVLKRTFLDDLRPVLEHSRLLLGLKRVVQIWEDDRQMELAKGISDQVQPQL